MREYPVPNWVYQEWGTFTQDVSERNSQVPASLGLGNDAAIRGPRQRRVLNLYQRARLRVSLAGGADESRTGTIHAVNHRKSLVDNACILIQPEKQVRES